MSEIFSEVIKRRRSVRKFTQQKVQENIMMRAFQAAVLAPNSSNTQTWDFFWVRDAEKKSKLVEFCLSQAAARSAQELVVISADPKKWKRSQSRLVNWADDSKAPKAVKMYYEKLIPFTYRWGVFNSLALFKWIVSSAVALFRPFMRGPHSKSELQLVAVKSAALAAENFVLSLTAEGLDSCMMEGFDEVRVKRLLGLSSSSRVVMVIAVGYRAEGAFWGPQYRLPLDEVLHQV